MEELDRYIKKRFSTTNFNFVEFDFNIEEYVELKDKIIDSEGSELISRDINTFINRNLELNSKDEISNVYIVNIEDKSIGLAFVNYHHEEERVGKILPEEIEIGLGILPEFRGKHIGSQIEKELSEKLLEIYPRFSNIVARVENNNLRSINSIINAGFEYIKDDEYHFKRK